MLIDYSTVCLKSKADRHEEKKWSKLSRIRKRSDNLFLISVREKYKWDKIVQNRRNTNSLDK